MKRVLSKLLPPGTGRRDFCLLPLSGIRVISNEGWRSFWKKFVRWCKPPNPLTGIVLLPVLLSIAAAFFITLVASRGQIVVIRERFGQLGNRLILFAHLLAFCAEKGFSVSNIAFTEYAGYFKSTDRDLLCRYPASKTALHSRFLRETLSYCGSAPFLRLCQNFEIASEITLEPDRWFDLEDPRSSARFDKKCTFVKGWLFRCPELLWKHRGVILEFFEPLQSYQDSIEKRLAEIRTTSDLLVGVHIRHGDYRTFLDGIYYYELDDYRRFMREAAQLFPDKKVGFLICSDERLQPHDFGEFACVLGDSPEIEDLYSLAKCDLLIGPPSTFTIWASFYGNVPLFPIKDRADKFELPKFQISRDPDFDIWDHIRQIRGIHK